MRTHGIIAAAISTLWIPLALAQDLTAPTKPTFAKLIGHWKLAGDTQDSSGNKLHAENHGVVFEAGKLGAKFDGRGQYLNVPHSDLLNLGTDDFTISMWIKTDELLDDDIGDVISKFDPETRKGLQLSVRNNTGVTSSLPNVRQLQFGIDSGTEPKWTDLGRPGGEKSILPFSLVAVDGVLIAGTCEPGKGGKGDVYYLKGKNQWDPFPVPHLANSVSSLAIHEGQLYAGTAKYRVAGSALAESENLNLGGQVFRFAIEHGKLVWISCGQLPNTEAVGGMTVCKGRLYASSLYKPAGFFRYEGGEKWTSLPTPNGKRTESLGVYNGYLWATGYDEGHIYRFDGETWTDMGLVGENTQTYSFAIHEGRLCVGTWPSGKVYRLGDKDQWEDMGRLGQELEVMGMLVHNGKLYAGTLPLAEVYRYDGGQKWTRIKQLDETPDVKYRRVWSMAQHRGKLACGVLPSGHVHLMETGVCTTSTSSLGSIWHHIAAVRSGKTLTIYRDGKHDCEQSDPSTGTLNLSNKQALRIGAGAGDTFRGRMKDVRIFRGAVSEDEIKRMAAEPIAALPVKQIIAHRGASARYPENTLKSFSAAKAMRATCIEIDVRRTTDGVLVPFHDSALDRTTNGTGPINEITWEKLKDLDAGSWKDPRFHEVRPHKVEDLIRFFHPAPNRIPGLPDDVVLLPPERIDILLDLKEDGEDFINQVVATVKKHGDPTRTIIGVRTLDQAKQFRKLLPQSRQLGLIADPQDIEAFALAGVEMIRLWPKWLTDETLISRVRKAGAKLHLNGETGLPDEILPLMKHQPDSLSSNDPEQLIETLLGLKP